MKTERRIHTSLAKRIFTSRFFIIAGMALFTVCAAAFAKEMIRRYEVTQDIKKLEQEISRLEHRNKELSDLLVYMKTDRFVEGEARAKFGLAKPGERIVVVPRSTTATTISEKQGQPSQEKRENPRLWREYFFEARNMK